MARFRTPMLFAGFRFRVIIPEKEIQIGASNVFSSPFDGTVWIGRAHQMPDSPDTPNCLLDAFGHASRAIVVMFPFGVSRDYGSVIARKLLVRYKSAEWCPLELDARVNEAAMEWIALRDVSYEGPVNIKPADDPEIARFVMEIP